MHLAGRGRDSSAESADETTEDGPALRDANGLAQRIADDEAAATALRERLRDEPMPTLEPDAAIASYLAEGEAVHALRARAILRSPGGDDALGYGGTLYLTSRRLVHLGQVVVSMQLSDIVETSLAGERLLLELRAGEGISLDVDRPRELRSLVAAASLDLRR